MRHKFNRKTVAFCILCALAFCFSALGVGAASTSADVSGSVTVAVQPEAEGIVMRLYEVADYVNGEYTLNNAFDGCSVNLTDLESADASQVAAEALLDFADANAIASTSAQINSEGNAVFTNLSTEKLYLIAPSEKVALTVSNYYYEIQPLLVSVPYMKDNADVYDVSVTAKFTATPKTEEKTSSVILNKVDPNSNVLKGAEFSLQSKAYYTDSSDIPANAETGKDSNGSYYWKACGTELTTNANGQIVVEKLPLGDYRFIEVQAPDGYVLDTTPHEFTLSDVGTAKADDNGVYTKDSGTIVELSVKNEPVPTSTPVSEPEKPDTPDGDSVLTSDTSNVYPIILIVLVAATIIALTVRPAKKNDNEG